MHQLLQINVIKKQHSLSFQNEDMGKQLHNCKIFFKEKNKPTSTYHNVSSIEKFKEFAKTKGFNFFHVYNKQTREYLGTVYDDDFYNYMQRTGIVYSTHKSY